MRTENYEIQICKYFFKNYCETTKQFRSNFGKVSIEQSMNTYVGGDSFFAALQSLEIPIKGTNYHDCKFALKIKPKCDGIIFFENWAPAEQRMDQINFDAMVELAKRFIKDCTVPTPTIRIRQSGFRTSYGYKHDAERYSGTYISNDAFIKAAEDLGVRSKPTDSGINRYYAFKLSPKIYQHGICLNEWTGKFATAENRLNELTNNKNQ